MPELTRRRDPDAQQETWLIYYGDVRVGVIAERIDNPDSTPGWQWARSNPPAALPKASTRRVVLSRPHGVPFWPSAPRSTSRNIGFRGPAIGLKDIDAHVYAVHMEQVRTFQAAGRV